MIRSWILYILTVGVDLQYYMENKAVFYYVCSQSCFR